MFGNIINFYTKLTRKLNRYELFFYKNCPFNLNFIFLNIECNCMLFQSFILIKSRDF